MQQTDNQPVLNTFEGGQNRDAAWRLSNPKQFWDAMAFRFGGRNFDNIASVELGNTIIPFANSGGSNAKVVGVLEDAMSQTVFVFVDNDGTGPDTILRYYPNDTTQTANGSIYLIAQSNDFNFNLGRPIHDIYLVAGRWLYWNVARLDGEQINGEEVYMLDVERASNMTTKRLTFTAWVPLTRQLSVSLTNVTFEVTNLAGTVVGTIGPVALTNRAQQRNEQIATALSASAFIASAVSYGNFVEIEMQNPQQRIRMLSADEQKVVVYPTNSYPNIITRRHVTMAKRPPKIAPAMRYFQGLAENDGWNILIGVNDRTYTLGYSTYQAMYRWRYVDGSYSTWSEPSAVAWRNLLSIAGVYNSKTVTDLIISLPDTLQTDRDFMWMIETVEIAFRKGNNGVWKSLGQKNLWECGSEVAGPTIFGQTPYSGPHWVMYSDAYQGVVTSDEAGAAPDTQAIKPHTYLPAKTLAFGVDTDDNGTTTAYVAGTLEQQAYPASARPGISGGASFLVTAQDVYNPAYNALRTIQRTYKSDSVYPFAIQYEDDFGRRSGAIPLGNLNTSTLKGVTKAYSYSALISGVAPDWATRYRLLRQLNQSVGAWETYIVSSYFSAFVANLDLTTGAVSNTAAIPAQTSQTHLFIPAGFNYDIQRPVENSASIFNGGTWYSTIFGGETTEPDPQAYLFAIKNRVNNFIGKDNARIRFLWQGTHANMLPIPNRFDYPIVGFYQAVPEENGPMYLVIQYDSVFSTEIQSLATFNNGKGLVYQVYLTQAASSSTYRETGISFPILAGGLHGGDTNQTSASNYATVNLDGNGDVYLRTLLPINEQEIVDPFQYGDVIAEVPVLFNNLEQTSQEDIGRINTIRPYTETIYGNDMIRFSQPFVIQGTLNGLPDFWGLNFVKSTFNAGFIQKMGFVNGNMIAVSQFGSKPFYIAKGRVLSLDGTSQLGRSEALLNPGDSPKRAFGTHHPESVKIVDGQMFCWDAYKGVMWRYAQDGFTDIGDGYGMRTTFLGYGDSDAMQGTVCVAGVDRTNKCYYIRFHDNPRGDGSELFCRVFNYGKSQWQGKMPFKGEAYGIVGPTFLSFFHGQLYAHLPTSSPLSFYGLPASAGEIEFIVNTPDASVFIANNISIFGLGRYEIEAETWPDNSYPSGMSTNMIGSLIVNKEGVMFASFLRDKTDPSQPSVDASRASGRQLRSTAFKIKIITKTDGTINPLTCVHNTVTLLARSTTS